MGKISNLASLATAVLIASATVATASMPQRATQVAAPQSIGTNLAAPDAILAAIKDERTSLIQAEPKCGPETTLRGTLVMETPERAGFPFSATTFASPGRTFTTVTTTEETSQAVIEEVARTLNSRADTYVKRLLRNCSL